MECDRTPATKQNHFLPLGSMFLHMYPVIGHPDSLRLTSGAYPCPYEDARLGLYGDRTFKFINVSRPFF